jgi:hypothetical protein
MPVLSHKYHRLTYISKNFKDYQPMRITMVPFLHERRVYLSRMKDQQQDYFYNTIVHKDPTYFSGVYNDRPTDTVLFIRMCLTESKYYVYSQRGILIKRVNYMRYTKMFGTPVAVSNNGLVFLFADKKKNHNATILVMNPEDLELV